MRLINVNSLNIESFLGQAEQPYGILSHKWGAAEVIFEMRLGLEDRMGQCKLESRESR